MTAMTQKDNLMFSIVIGLWILVVFYFNPRLLILLIGPENLPAKLSVILFIICLDVFWFYAIFHMAVVTFSYFHKKKSLSLKPLEKPYPKVAVLYVTYNDFRADAVSSCLNQEYDDFHTFILDDSTNPEYIQAVDEFAGKFNDKVTIIRRNDRNGFKAGNLNHALSQIAGRYEYFAIADSDSIFPPDFIKKLLPYFSVSEKIGFVQAMQRANPEQKSYFARAMGFNLDLHYKRYLLPKEKYGFIMLYGHGAIVRTDAWEGIGGFPEIVSEDLGFSTKLRRCGYEGILAEDVVCYEDYPETYRHYRRRTEKWIKGTLEFLFKEYPLFLKTKGVCWFEKFDVLACSLNLSMGFPFLLFLFLGALALPMYFTNFRFHGPVFLMPISEGKSAVSIATGLRYNVYWTYDFYILMMVTILYPLIPVFVDLARKPSRMLLYMAVSTQVFLSTLVWVSFHTLSFLFTKRADFLVTAHERGSSTPKGAGLPQRYDIKQLFMLMAELAFAGVFIVIMIKSNNLWLISVATALLLSPFVFFWDLETKTMRFLSLLPFLFSLVLLFLIGKSIIIR